MPSKVTNDIQQEVYDYMSQIQLKVTQGCQGANEPGFAQSTTSMERGVDEQSGACGHDDAEQQFGKDGEYFESIVFAFSSRRLNAKVCT